MSLKGPKSTCFCALNASSGMLGLYWFKDVNSKTVRGTARSYVDSTLI